MCAIRRREGGEPLAAAAHKNLSDLIDAADAAVGTTRLFSVREEFPSEWAKFTRLAMSEFPDDTGAPLTLPRAPSITVWQRRAGAEALDAAPRAEHYPFWSQGRLVGVKRVSLYARADAPLKAILPGIAEPTALDNGDPSLGGLYVLTVGESDGLAVPSAVEDLALRLTDNTMSDLWVAVTWAGAS